MLKQGLHFSDKSIASSCIAVGLTPVLVDLDTAVLQLNNAILNLLFAQQLPLIRRH